MDLALLVYAISTMQGIKVVTGLLLALSILVCLGLFVYMGDQSEYRTDSVANKAWAWKRVKLWFSCTLFCALVFAALPTQKTAYTMVAAYATQRVAENEKVQQLSGKVLTIIEQKLDGYIAEGLDKAEGTVNKEIKK